MNTTRSSPNRKLTPRILLAGLLAAFAGTAHAQWQVDCFAKVDCAGIIHEALDPGILATYPANRYKMVVFGSNHEFVDGGGAAYAVVGLSEKVRVAGVDLTVLPLKRYSASQPWAVATDEVGQTQALANALRAALDRMNQRCASAPDCPVYIPYQ